MSPTGSGDFTDSGQNLGNHISFGVDLGDLDGDGDLDAFVANRNQRNRVWVNEGSGNFTASGQMQGSHNSFATVLGDLDGDGDLDSFVANFVQANRVWLNVPAKASEVLVRGSGWTQPFLDHLDSLSLGTDGYSIPVGSGDQLDALPWSNIDQILIRFNTQVNVDLSDLTLTGVNVAAYGLAGLTTGTGATGDFEAVWTLTAPIDTDKLRIRLDGTTGSAVTDTADNVLDGEWIDTVSSYPSGDDIAGGDFAFRFNVLPADFDGDGTVTLNPDAQNLLAGNGASIGAGNYSPFIDYNGDGTVTLNPDVQKGLSQLGTFLPPGTPSAASSADAGSSPHAASTTAPSTATTTKPNATTVAIDRVISIPSRRHAIGIHLDAEGFVRAHGAVEPRTVDVTGASGSRRITARGVLDPADLNSQDANVDLLTAAVSIL